METVTTFKDALALDMERKGLTEAALGRLLNEERPITQQAINKWKARGFPPLERLERLKQVLGPDSFVSRLTPEQLYGTASRLMVYPTTVRTAAIKASDDWLHRQSLLMRKALGRHLLDMEPPVALVPGHHIRPDYVTDTHVVEVVYVQDGVASKNMSGAVLRLLTVSKAQALTPLLIVICAGTVTLPSQVAAACELYGVEVFRAGDGVMAAMHLRRLSGDDTLLEPDE